MKTMGRKGRQFLEYDLLPLIGIIAAAVFVILILIRIFGPAQETVLYAAFYDGTLQTGEKQALTEETERLLQTEPGQVLLDESFDSKRPKDLERLQVLAANGALDVVTAPEEVFRGLAACGYFRDLSAFFPEGKLYRTKGYLDTDEVSFEDREVGEGEEKAYGLKLKDGTVTGVVEGNKHLNEAVLFLGFLQK